jgi:hypothetical protein
LKNPEGYDLEEPEVAEDSSAMLGIEDPAKEVTFEEPRHSQDLERSPSSGIYSPRHRSLRSKSLVGQVHIGRAMRIRIGAMGGWSAIAGAGATALLTRVGPFPGTQLAELGAVWAGITAFLWIILAKLAK